MSAASATCLRASPGSVSNSLSAACARATTSRLASACFAARLTRTTGLGVLPAGAVGAALLLGADLAAGRLLSPFQIPVGLLTSALGGFYLLWLLSSAEPGRRA